MSHPFAWQADYAIGDPEIDAQHRMLFDLANRIVSLMDPQRSFSELKASIQALMDYIRVHFDAEEERMREWGYPDLAYHTGLHATIRQDMIRLLKESKNLEELKKDLDLLMSQWILVHILQEDSKLGLFYRKNIVQP